MRPERPSDDHYPTPPEATRALLGVESFGGGIWEPCAGSGEMAAVLRESGYTVCATTIGQGRHDRDAPKHRVLGGLDFFQSKDLAHPNIITNPPYRDAEKIISHALAFSPVKAAFLLNIKFLGSEGRMRGLFAERPPVRVWAFADRITMYPAGYDGPKQTTTETFAWFVWESPIRKQAPSIGWICSKDFRSVHE